MRSLMTILSSISLFSFIGCQGTNGSYGTVNTAVPQAAPSATAQATPTAQPSSSPVVSSQWDNVHEVTSCEAMNPRFCTGNYGFTVYENGTYVVGPDPQGGTLEGQLTSDEFTELNQSADAVVAGSSLPEECDATGPVPGSSDHATLTLPDQRVVNVYQATGVPRKTCYGGGRVNGKRLHDDMAQLMTKYYRTPFP